MSRSIPRLLTVAAAAAATVGLTALPALAHVSVSSPGATQGGFGVVTFRVPTESDTASTVGLKVQLPADAPLAFVSVQPKAGWTHTVTRAKLPTPVRGEDGEQVTDYPAQVEWRITPGAAGVKPGEFDEFRLSVGPMPKQESITFKAIQSYSDGKDVAWIEEQAEGGTEPEHPAPVLELAAAGAEDAASAGTAGAATPSVAQTYGGAGEGSVTGAYVLGGAGLLAGLAALGLTLTRRRTPTTGS